jgi:hypothetical protein
MRALDATTIAALRAFPNAPGVRFRVYVAQGSTHREFSDRVVQDSLGSIEWTLERSYAQLTPGDIQFQVRDHDEASGFEAYILSAGAGIVNELQIWAAPAWGGAGDWAMLFHGYIEPSGITRSAADAGSGSEPRVPLKDVYAKSYLSARLDAVRPFPPDPPGAYPLDAWGGVMRLEDCVRKLGDRLIAGAGHEPIDYDIQVAMIPTKDGRLVLSAWNQQDQSAIDGPSWIIREDDGYWWILQWHWDSVAAAGTLYQYQLDKRTYRVTGTTAILQSNDHAEYGRFHYVNKINVLLSISRKEAWPSLSDFTPEVLKELVLIDRRNGRIVARWRADAHYISTVGPLWWRPTGYCAVACPAGGAQPHVVLWMDLSNWWGAAHIMATLSLTNLVFNLDCGWHSGVTAGYIAGGAICATSNNGHVHAGNALCTDPAGGFVYLGNYDSTDNGVSFTREHADQPVGFCVGTTRQDPEHEHARQAGGNIIFDGEDNNHYWCLFDNTVNSFSFGSGTPVWMQEFRHDNNEWSECVGLIFRPAGGGLPDRWNVISFYVNARMSSVVLWEFYAGTAPAWNQLRILDMPGYFTKLNWVPFASRAYNGTTGHFWSWRAYAAAPLALISDRFWPVIDLTVTGAPVTKDETVRDFIGRICEATGHMILFPGKATPHGAIIWRVRPRHLQPPDYCLTGRDIMADGVEIQGPRKLRLIVTTQGATFAYPDTETAALLRQSELAISNDGIPLSVADDFAYWLWLLFDTQNRAVKCELDAAIWVEVGDSVDLSLGAVDYFQGVVTRQSLNSATGRGQVELLCQETTPTNRLPVKGEIT